MHIIQQVLFILLFIIAVYLFTRKVRQIRRNIFLGKSKTIDDHKRERWRNVLLLAFGQKKMFRNWIPAILHFFVYAGFIIINIEITEIILDGLTGKHRMFSPLLGPVYNVLIGCFEILALLVIFGCAMFLIRRNVLKIKRFWQREMTHWPKSDANYILIMEIILMLLFLTMNTTDSALQLRHAAHYTQTGPFWCSALMAPLFDHTSTGTLIGLERGAWWLHITGILFFLNYLPYSKHFHIILAFPNAYYADLEPEGKMANMPEIEHEVKLMFEPPPPSENAPAGAPSPERFGAKEVTDLTWKNLMDAYSCTECGRCTAACPANQTGKLLSPRKIMMDTRDRLEEVGRKLNKDGKFEGDGKTLLYDYITPEELWACTTCNACVKECPVSIKPLDIILQLRRSLVMDDAKAPAEWNAMFSNIENNRAPWKFSPEDREKWREDL
ncbi:MAG: (Fe-S)-binding protein [Chitinophagaceae bacterium]|nr:MAG: (Fe-S)-binding protein [Chitinophagaceae bacterium]